MLLILISLILVIVFFGLSVIHFYWGLGGKWGKNATIPTNDNNRKVLNPKALECFIVGIGLLAFGLLILISTGILPLTLPHKLIKSGLWIIFLIFSLRFIGEFNYVGIFKKVRSTQFAQADTMFYSPFCLAVALLVLVLTLAN